MRRILNRRKPPTALAIPLVLLLCSWFTLFLAEVKAQEVIDNDYFSETRSNGLLRNVEQYHLSRHMGFWVEFKRGQYAYALKELQFVLRYFPNHPRALALLGALARIKKTPSLPIVYYERAIKLYPQRAFTYAQYGDYLIDVGNRKVGISLLEKAIQLDPKLPQAHAWLAKAYQQQGNLELARQEAKIAKELRYKGKVPDQSDSLGKSGQGDSSLGLSE